MDPKLLQQLSQGQQSGGQAGFDPNVNPFESLESGGAAPAAPQPQAPVAPGAGAAPQAGPGGALAVSPVAGLTPPVNQLEAGKGTGKEKSLVDAVRALHSYISESTDRDSILMGRNLIKLITRLINRGEDEQLGNLERGF